MFSFRQNTSFFIKEMVKQSSEKYAEYKMRTSHGGPMNSARQNNVQVAESSGCCSSSKKNVYAAPSRPTQRQQPKPPQQRPQHQQTAHERTHKRLDPPDPFYARQGRIRKNPNRGRKTFQSRNQVHTTTELRQTNTNKTSTPAPQSAHHQPAKAKTNCCCTIL